MLAHEYTCCSIQITRILPIFEILRLCFTLFAPSQNWASCESCNFFLAIFWPKYFNTGAQHKTLTYNPAGMTNGIAFLSMISHEKRSGYWVLSLYWGNSNSKKYEPKHSPNNGMFETFLLQRFFEFNIIVSRPHYRELDRFSVISLPLDRS